jgi:CRP-like cAMP-binding protein
MHTFFDCPFTLDTSDESDSNESDILDSLTTDESKLLAGIRAPSRFVPAGVDLYVQDEECDHYLVILEGWVAQSINLRNGIRQILDFRLPGETVGAEPGCKTLMNHSASCITPVRTYAIPIAQLERLLERQPRLALRVLRVLAHYEARAYEHLVNISCRDARGRIAHLLVELFGRSKGRLPSVVGAQVDFPLRHGHIADALGLTTVHVSRTLSVLRDQGIADVQHRCFVVLDPEALLAAAGFGGSDASAPRSVSSSGAAKARSSAFASEIGGF